MLRNKGGFTLIELVMIIVILGILAAVAIPRYIDLRDDAERSSATAVLGGLNSSFSVAYAAYLTSKTRCNGTLASDFLDEQAEYEGCLDGGFPNNWSALNDTTIRYVSSGGNCDFTLTQEDGDNQASVAQSTNCKDDIDWPKN